MRLTCSAGSDQGLPNQTSPRTPARLAVVTPVCLAVLLLAFALSGCAQVDLMVVAVGSPSPLERLEVGVLRFKIDEAARKMRGRGNLDFDASYLPARLVETLPKSNWVGHAYLIPQPTPAVDVVVGGTILASDGETMSVSLDATRIGESSPFLSKTYSLSLSSGDRSSFEDPSGIIWNRPVNDLTQAIAGFGKQVLSQSQLAKASMYAGEQVPGMTPATIAALDRLATVERAHILTPISETVRKGASAASSAYSEWQWKVTEHREDARSAKQLKFFNIFLAVLAGGASGASRSNSQLYGTRDDSNKLMEYAAELGARGVAASREGRESDRAANKLTAEFSSMLVDEVRINLEGEDLVLSGPYAEKMATFNGRAKMMMARAMGKADQARHVMAKPMATAGKDSGPAPSSIDRRTMTNSVGMRLVEIKRGPFPAESDSKMKVERIEMGFMMGTTEVTQGQWKAVMGTDPSHFKGADLPVEQVSWHDAQEFCLKLSEKEKKKYRLPTEAEWEYACRAGTKGEYGGTGVLGDMGWHEGNSGNKTHPLGGKKANAWGLYDMHGNVWEWCEDNYSDSSASRVVRGGSWINDAGNCRSAYRSHSMTGGRNGHVGFRVCLDLNE